MKKSLKRTFGYTVGVIALALFAFSCANPLQYDATSNQLAGAKSLVPALPIDQPNYKLVLDLANGSTVASYKIDRVPNLYEQVGPITVTKLWYQTEGANLAETGTEVVGFDFTSTSPVLAVYVKGSSGGNLYDYRPAGVTGDTELHTIVNSSGKFAEISHVDFAWVVGPVTPPVDPQDPTYSISGFVFHDYDADGVKDENEPGLSGVNLTLSNGTTVPSGSDGSYSFTGLAAGSYTVNAGSLDGYFATPYDTPVTSQSKTVPASAAGVNFGLSYESISGRVFRDLDADGVLDSGENGIAGVALTLSGAASVSSPSDPNGYFVFDHLKGGSSVYTVTAADVSGEFHTPYLAPVVSWTGTASASGVDFGYSHESVAGLVFYDANRNDVYDFNEPTLSGFTVRLNTGATALSASDGSYLFDNLKGETTYTVTADDRTGFVHSVAASRTVYPENAVPAQADFGFAVDYSWIPGKLANGFTIGYWKNNVDKAIAGKTNGIQVTKASLLGYLGTLSTFALEPLNFSPDVAGLKEASKVLSATGSDPIILLKKQLMGSEFNYASGASIGGNALVTAFFLYDGEYMIQNASSFSSAQLLAQKDRYDAYNNSHGGAVIF